MDDDYLVKSYKFYQKMRAVAVFFVAFCIGWASYDVYRLIETGVGWYALWLPVWAFLLYHWQGYFKQDQKDCAERLSELKERGLR